MKNSQKGFTLPLLLIIIAVLVIGGGTYIYSHNKNYNGFSLSMSTTTLSDNRPDSSSSSSTASITTTSVKIALLTVPAKDGDEKNLKGCDLVTLVERTVPPTTTPLNAALKELFAKKEPWPYSETYPGNFISSRKNLFFDKATIENGVAKVYLTGQVGPLSGECDDPRLFIQINETALQFATVKSVQIYLNGNILAPFSEKGE